MGMARWLASVLTVTTWLTIHPAAGLGCNETTEIHTIQHVSHTIESPNYPNPYDSNLNCSWRVFIPEDGGELDIVIENIALESNCSKDVLTLYDVYGDYMYKIAEICDNNTYYYVHSYAPSVYIQFTTDDTNNGQGFFMKVMAVPYTEYPSSSAHLSTVITIIASVFGVIGFFVFVCIVGCGVAACYSCYSVGKVRVRSATRPVAIAPVPPPRQMYSVIYANDSNITPRYDQQVTIIPNAAADLPPPYYDAMNGSAHENGKRY